MRLAATREFNAPALAAAWPDFCRGAIHAITAATGARDPRCSRPQVVRGRPTRHRIGASTTWRMVEAGRGGPLPIPIPTSCERASCSERRGTSSRRRRVIRLRIRCWLTPTFGPRRVGSPRCWPQVRLGCPGVGVSRRQRDSVQRGGAGARRSSDAGGTACCASVRGDAYDGQSRRRRCRCCVRSGNAVSCRGDRPVGSRGPRHGPIRYTLGT